MTLRTQDPDYTATRLIRAAKKAKKPVRVFLGVNCKGGKDRQLVAVGDMANLSKTAAREELTIHPDANPQILSAALVAVWGRLAKVIPHDNRPSLMPHWRKRGYFAGGRKA